MKKTKLLTLAAMTSLLLTSLMATSALAVTVPPFTLSYSSEQVQYTLPQGTIFNGTISTSGSVRFWASAPNGAQIVNIGIVDKNAVFGFVAQQNGTYTLNFENDLKNQIQVTFSYETNPDISGGNNSTEISSTYLLIAIIIIAVTGSLLVLLIMRRKRKIEPFDTQDSTSLTGKIHT
jgi:hypothetical protein